MAGKITQEIIEVLLSITAPPARVSQNVIELLIARTTPSPTTITGGGISQHVIEVLMRPAASVVRANVSQEVIEVLMSPTDAAAVTPGVASTRGWFTTG
jgi:hypothetical protein